MSRIAPTEHIIDPTLLVEQHSFLQGVVEYRLASYLDWSIVITKERDLMGHAYFYIRGTVRESTIYYDMSDIYD